ncbi:MAG: dockerin type I repeat-containing protein [candidate division Zixibacteria bacterium]|nr:dockerin type I repeat-containing protein [candidate division Zixibacteria bacterium]MBU1469541.1 dockerin type I repeat-containing protein [candidate division Zixibacteria bacterium]MBU2624557.1 dockerin type I repeat-containing protein [candidate division Zixibacteria bacterium]
MKRALIFSFILLCIFTGGNAFSQTFSDPFAPTFSSAAGDNVQFDFDVADSLADEFSIVHQIIYRDPAVNAWNLAEMTELYQVCSVYTYSATAEYVTTTSQFEWYNRSELDTVVVTQSPKNIGGTFPVPSYLLADLGADPTGDAEGTSASYLDITHCYGSYSDTKLYVRFENNGGGFPTSSGFTFFVYSVGIIDPDATDSIAYAFVYASVPLLIGPGLYKIDPADSSFSQIGNITTNISGNALSMSCNISDLTAQPGWSDWPPPSNLIVLAPVTATQSLSGMATNDWGKIAIFQPQSNLSDYSSNNAPTLSGASAVAGEGRLISASVTYTDTDNHLAVIRDFHVELDLHPMSACVKDYASGTLFETEVTVTSGGWYDYYFEFSDGAATVTTDIDSVYVDLQTYVAGDADGNGAVDIDDVVFLIQYIFASGPAPDPLESGDADCSGAIDIDDAVYLIAYIFSSGPTPCAL